MLTRDALHADVRDRVFRLAEHPEPPRVPRAEVPPGTLDDPGHAFPLDDLFPRLDPPPPPPRRIGAEVEWIPVSMASGRAVPIEGEGGSLAWLRQHAAAHGWSEDGEAAVPRFLLPGGGVFFFEPGGQLEYASPPHSGPGPLLGDVRRVAEALEASAHAAGTRLVARGLDPVTPLADVPLQLCSPRYLRMDRYLSALGQAGPLMMRQTASCQVNLDFPDEPLLAWRVLNAAAPFLTAMFASSPLREGRATGHVSTRAAIWRALDPARTGIFRAPLEADAAAAEYLDFALAAPWFLAEGPGGGYAPFGDRLSEADEIQWRAHLTTLFPEVRPRGYLEVRSIDALPAALLPAPVVLLTGLLHHRASLHEAVDRLGEPNPELLTAGATAGLADRRIAAGARTLVRLGLDGARALGPDVVPTRELEGAARFFETRTLRGWPALDARDDE